MELINSRPELMNLSFSGCGFLCVYHAGVAAAIKQYAPQLLQNKILGASAGSIIACGLITNVCISSATTTILKVISQARLRTFGPLHPEFNLLGVVRDELENILPKDAYEMCTGRLVISLTRWKDHKNVMIDEFTSNADLIDAIMCSCFIPLYCGIQPPTFRGVQYIDGGVSDNQPCYDEHTVTVSPFSGESDICPPDWDSGSLLGVDFNGTSIRFTARNMFRLMACLWPRSTEDCSKMCIQGFKDALRFLTKNGLSPCIRCLTIQTIDGCGSDAAISDKDDEAVTARPRCMTSPSSAPNNMGIGRMRNRSSTSILNMRGRGESECEACCDSDMFMEDINVESVFPKIMQKPFTDAIAAEKSVFEYFLSFRIIRYATTALGISKFPLDIAVAFVKSIHNYLDVMSPPRWFIEKFRGLSELVALEMEKQTTRYTKFSCLVGVTEVDRFGSTLAHSTWEANGEEKEIELSDEARKELRFLQERDRRRQMRETAKTAAEESYDVDSFEHVVKFTKTHDLMYEFHYFDENNERRTMGLFKADNHQKHQNHHKKRHLNKLDEEKEEEDVRFIGGIVSEEEEEEQVVVVEKDAEIDSGVEAVNIVSTSSTVASSSSSSSKRDACCSPVREFSELVTVPPPPMTSSESFSPKPGRGRGTGRRYINNDVNMRSKPSTPIPKKTTTKTMISSSDSEEIDGTEKLFVPSRKAWRASSDFDQKDGAIAAENIDDTTA